MADFTKVKKKKTGRFGEPLDLNEASNNLEQPEFAPAAPEQTKKSRGKTGRTEPLNFKVTKEFDKEFRTLHFHSSFKKKVEFLEACLEAYKELNNLR